MKSYESKPADAIQGRTEQDYLSRLNAALTSVRGVNRTDVLTLGRTFGSVGGTMRVPSSHTPHPASEPPCPQLELSAHAGTFSKRQSLGSHTD